MSFLLNLFDQVADTVIPAFYYTFKFVAILWMALPQTKYAAVFPISKIDLT